MNIVVFGDSIAWGAFDYEGGGWVDRLKKKMYPNHFVYNCAISGNTTEGVLDNIYDNLRLRADEEMLIIVAIGVNDSSKGIFKIDLKQFEANIKAIIHQLQFFDFARTFKAVRFVGLTPIDESKTNPVEWDDKLFYTEADTKAYDEKLKDVLLRTYDTDNGSPYIDVRGFITKEHLVDGVHLNDKGHELIADRIFAEIQTDEAIQPYL